MARSEQDGWKPKLLCHECEQRFGGWEKTFSERVFVPYHEGTSQAFRYGPWMAKFAASVSWRVLTLYKLGGLLEDFPQEMKEAADAAMERWRGFLLGRENRLGPFEQHVLLLDSIKSTTVPSDEMPPNINRYLLRSVDLHVAYTDESEIVYAKMGRFLLIGFVRMPEARKLWKNTKLHIGGGALLAKEDRSVPEFMLDLLHDRARGMDRAWEGLSDRQSQNINETMLQDLDRVANSDSLRAMDHDVRMFGRAAFRSRPNEK